MKFITLYHSQKETGILPNTVSIKKQHTKKEDARQVTGATSQCEDATIVSANNNLSMRNTCKYIVEDQIKGTTKSRVR